MESSQPLTYASSSLWWNYDYGWIVIVIIGTWIVIVIIGTWIIIVIIGTALALTLTLTLIWCL